MNMVVKAVQLATKAHEGQKDKGGQPYMLHPLRLMLHMSSDEARMVALLHDVLEDTEVTATDLREEGFPEEVILSVIALTKKENEEYDLYLKRVKENPLATKVKLADLKDNMDLSRIPEPDTKDYARVAKYQDAFQFLTQEDFAEK